MSTLRLILPGFLDSLNDYGVDEGFLPPLPQLRRFLARAQSCEDQADSFAQALLHALPLSIESRSNSSAALSYLADSGVAPEGVCFRLDPVHLKVDRDHARLLSGENLPLWKEEAEALIETFNRHFSEDGLHLRCFDAKRWYLCLPENPGIVCADLDQVVGRSVEPFNPTGRWARQWKSWLTEAQMLFFEHPVNERREARGQLPVNSLWLWGGDRLPEGSLTEPVQLLGEHELLRGLAAHFELPLASFSAATMRPLTPETTRNSVLLDNEAYSLLINGDLHGWREALPKLEAHLQRAETLLREGFFSEVELLPLNGHLYRLNRWRLRQFWRRGSSLAAHFFPDQGQ